MSAHRPSAKRGGTGDARRSPYPPQDSVGHQVRWAHRALQRELEERLRPFGISSGMWHFLRALWEEDGLSQRELSERVGTSEPTTVSALHAMEKRGLALRVPNSEDRRKSNIFLTRPAKELREMLLREAREVNRTATAGIAADEIERLKTTIGKIRKNLAAASEARRAAEPRLAKKA
ncbi:MAG TPA: MarR family transcriptional regulator [Stellaceae bacterium]|jgi:MarR family transcriptional regulator, organic hydroperoxide resistance regulator|nr:MarR family transcriptional regulator [Stellaceae bacterium]